MTSRLVAFDEPFAPGVRVTMGGDDDEVLVSRPLEDKIEIYRVDQRWDRIGTIETAANETVVDFAGTRAMTFFTDGDKVGLLTLWEVPSGRKLWARGGWAGDWYRAFGFVPGSPEIWFLREGGGLVVTDPTDGAAARTLRADVDDDVAIFSPRGDSLLVVGRADGAGVRRVACVDAARESQRASWSVASSPMQLAWDADDRVWLLYSDRLEARDPAHGGVTATIDLPSAPHSAALSPDGACLVTVGIDAPGAGVSRAARSVLPANHPRDEVEVPGRVDAVAVGASGRLAVLTLGSTEAGGFGSRLVAWVHASSGRSPRELVKTHRARP